MKYLASKTVFVFGCFGFVLFAIVGCKPNVTSVALHEPNYLYAHSIATIEDTELDKPLADTQDLLTEWFGTLDDPKLPPLFADDDYKDLVSLNLVQKAAGIPAKTIEPGETGLYRQLCASCHGESGQGRGPVAASQNPYPREFRHGVFKYKSTPRRFKPLKEDIAKSLRRGLAGSQMPLFDKLEEAKLDALVDYVVFLSIRGEFERKLLYNAAYELDLDKDRVYSAFLKTNSDEGSKKTLAGQLESATELLTQIADVWVESADSKEEVTMPDFPLIGTETEENRHELIESIARGKQLFLSETAACAKCHGENALGAGTQLPDYDDWTKDWTTKVGIKPTALEELSPFMARGGMKPQALKPRNIVEGKFRGGREPIEVYRRIRYGIVGSPMPAATVVASSDQKGLLEADLWHIVNYVLSIAEQPQDIAIESKVTLR
jgi:mono/diheme cytochrome c family protein